MSEEWGQWIDHDGSGCPIIGMLAQVEVENKITKIPKHYTLIGPRIFQGIVRRSGLSPGRGDSWNWRRGNRVIRYRIRKPRGLTILEHIAADTQPVKESA